jgi:hypothetical protein
MHPAIDSTRHSLYDSPCQYVILVNFSYLAITLSKADFGPLPS